MCGIVGLFGSSEAAKEAFLGLTTLQHRGQDAAGILTYDSTGFHQVKNLGLAESVFTQQNMKTLTGPLAIGHARYSTVGQGGLVDVQPFLLSYPYGIGLVHNGNIINYADLAKEMRTKKGWSLLSRSDSEILLNLLADGLQERVADGMTFQSICKALDGLYSKVQGSFSVIAMIAEHGLLAFRDSFGLRPLILGKRERHGRTEYMVSSESVALYFNGYEVERDLEPGEAIFIDSNGVLHSQIISKREQRPCMFEWIYFASAESEVDSVPVYGARIRLGQALTERVQDVLAEKGIKIDLVAAVPDTARTSATALAEGLGVPYREVLIKNRYIKRTFILSSQEHRQQAINLKLSPVRSELVGKCVLLVDDSIVRGNTSKKIVELVRKAGAASVVFVSTCPPIQHPCFYGIDFPNREELLASERSVAQMEQEIDADALVFMDISGLERAISREFKPCMACLDGDYPGDVSAGLRFAETRLVDQEAAKKEINRESKERFL